MGVMTAHCLLFQRWYASSPMPEAITTRTAPIAMVRIGIPAMEPSEREESAGGYASRVRLLAVSETSRCPERGIEGIFLRIGSCVCLYLILGGCGFPGGISPRYLILSLKVTAP